VNPPDEIAQATIGLRPPCPMTRLPTPKHFEPSAMPMQDGLRLWRSPNVRFGSEAEIAVERARGPLVGLDKTCLRGAQSGKPVSQ